MELTELERLFFYDDPKKRAKWFDLFKDPVWIPEYNISLDKMRQISMAQLKAIAKSGVVYVTDFFTDPTNIFTAHENIGMVAGSTTTKFTVHYNLFGGTIVALHTQRHKYLFPELNSLDITGCFCLTELGFGNNAVMMETTVTYDDKTKQFVVDSPTTLSQKYWITNGAVHANYAVVFGQTIVKGKNEGVNAFLVPIRDRQLKAYPNVEISDMGYKIGLNGVDNATLKFHKVRIPRENMLNKFCDVNEKGEFVSDIKGIQQRFFKVTERLLSGRLCIASMTFGASKTLCYVTIRYAQQRLAVSENGKSETPIMEYQLQQNSLIPLVSRVVSLNMLHNFAKKVFVNTRGYENELLSICCIDKTLIGWHCGKAANVMRERCGGQGFLSANRFSEIIAGAHAAMTAEGDNRVLMVKIVKDYLTNISKGHTKLPAYTKQTIQCVHHLCQLETLQNLLRMREVVLYETLLNKMASLKGAGKSNYDILMKYTSDETQELATAYGERIAIEQCLIALAEKIQIPSNKEILSTHFKIFALEIIIENMAFFLFNEAIAVNTAKEIREIFRQLIKKAASNIDSIINSFNVPKFAIYTPIAGDYVKYNEQPYYGEVVNAKL